MLSWVLGVLLTGLFVWYIFHEPDDPNDRSDKFYDE